MVTIIEVAKHAKVSPAVVSRVLNADDALRISDETRERVLASVAALKYVPRHAARSLRMNIPSVISLVIPDTTSTLNASLLEGVEFAARAKDLSVNLIRAEILDSGFSELLRFVREGRTDGLLVQIPDKKTIDIYLELEQLPVPVVLLNSVSSGDIPTIIMDDQTAVSIAMDYLVESGHTEIGFAGGFVSHDPALRRQLGFEKYIHEHKLKSEQAWITNFGLTNKEGFEAADYFLNLENKPTAVIVANVNAAMGFIAQAHREGFSLPGDLSIVAIHDVPYADATWPPLTTVEMPFYSLGLRGVELLLTSTDEIAHEIITTPSPKLHIRGSVQTLR